MLGNVFGGMVAALTADQNGATLPPREDRFVGKASNAERVAETWTDIDVRRDRLVREAVQVTLPSGEVRVYKSTRAAFRDLRLPDTKHIRFRLKLKQSRVHAWPCADGREYRFELVPRE